MYPYKGTAFVLRAGIILCFIILPLRRIALPTPNSEVELGERLPGLSLALPETVPPTTPDFWESFLQKSGVV
jgi:hypothetical protein